jgi:hypothetical protein
LKRAPTSAQTLTGVPKCRKAGICHTGKICGLDKVLSSMDGSTVCYEFNVNESTIYTYL